VATTEGFKKNKSFKKWVMFWKPDQLCVLDERFFFREQFPLLNLQPF